jgi:hypothetical protein
MTSAINKYPHSPSAASSSSPSMAVSAVSPAVAAARATLASINLSNYDAVQTRLMDEKCILVDEKDNALGAADKKTCM